MKAYKLTKAHALTNRTRASEAVALSTSNRSGSLRGSTSFVSVQRDGAIARVTWSRPERRNAIGAEVASELTAVLAGLRDDPDLQVVVLGAQAPPFCAGWDVGDIASVRGADEATVRRFFEPGRALLDAITGLPQVVIAAVQGAALGFGCSVLARCDLVFAASDATFGLPEAALGFAPALALPEVMERLSPTTALRWAATADRWPAHEAMCDGLVSAISPPESLEAAVAATATRLCAHPAGVVTQTKQLVTVMAHQSRAGRVRIGLDAAVARLVDAGATADHEAARGRTIGQDEPRSEHT